MKQHFPKKGVMLIYALIVVSLLVILLTASIVQLQNSVFVTNKLESETKAYWASFAGLEYAEARMSDNINAASVFPPSVPLFNGKIGDFSITEQTVPGGVVIYGKCERINSDFLIGFNKQVSDLTGTAASIVPSSPFTYAGKTVKYYSCNAINPDNGKSNIADTTLTVSNSPGHTIKLPKAADIYVSVEGFNSGHVVNLERLYQAGQGRGKYFAALYVGGIFDAELSGKFSVTDNDGRYPNIVVMDAMTIRSWGPSYTEKDLGVPDDIDVKAKPDRYGNGPLSLQNGTIFTGADQVMVNGLPIMAADDSNMQKYGITVQNVGGVELPKIEIPKDKPTARKVPGGSYTFVERPAHIPSVFSDLMSRVPLLGRLFGGTRDTARVSKVGEKNYELFYFSPNYNVSNFTVEKYQKGRVLTAAKKFKSSIGGGIINLVLLGSLDRQINSLKREIDGDMIELKTDVFYRFIPNGIPNTINETQLRQAPFDIREDILAMTVTDDLSVYNNDFVFRTLEADMSVYNYGKYKKAEYARSSLMLTKPGATDKVRIYSEKSIDVKGFLAGQGELISGENVSIEAGGKLDAEGESEIAIFATENLNINYVSASFANYKAPIEVETAASICTTKPRFKLEDIRDARESYVKTYINALLNVKLEYEPGKFRTLEDTLKSYGMSSKSGYNTPYNYIYELICRYPNFIDPSIAINPRSYFVTFIPTSNIRGILYAKGDMIINVAKGDVSLEGIVVCEGKFQVYTCNNLGIRYDPELSSITVATKTDHYDLSQIFFNKF